jgi:hypothetical protein
MRMSDAPISAPETEGEAEIALLEAARAFDRAAHDRAVTLWRERVIPAVRAEWPEALADALCGSLELAMAGMESGAASERGDAALRAWDAIERWLRETELPLAGGRSTPAHFRKHKRDPAVYRAVGLAEHLRLAGGGRAVVLNTQAMALAALGRMTEAASLLREAERLRREAFGWREEGLRQIQANLMALTGRADEDAAVDDLVPVGPDRYVAVTSGQPELRRRLLAAAQLVPILRRAAD